MSAGTGTETVGQQDPTTRASSLRDTGTVADRVQNPTNKQGTEEQVANCPTSTTTTTASTTVSSTSITSTGPTTITTTIDITGPTPVTTTTVTTTGVTMITTNTTPLITIDSDAEEEVSTEPNSKHQKMNHPWDTRMA
jgi:hypothetical protein